MQCKFSHLKYITINDTDKKDELPVRIILGAGSYIKIKTSETARVGQPGKPIVKLTELGGNARKCCD